MKLFADSNILLDVLENRDQHYEYSSQIWTLTESGKVQVFISAISFNNIFYLVRKHAGRERAQQALQLLNTVFTMLPLSQDIVNKAITSKLPDFENAIQFFSALSLAADCIVSRNVKDFPQGSIPIFTPENFLAFLCHEKKYGL